MTKGSPSCINLVFATSPYLISNTGVKLLSFEKCHLSRMYGVIDFKVPLPLSNVREVWNYKKC